MARMSKIVLVAALVAMLAMAPVLDARPLTEDAAVAVAHKRKLNTLGLILAKKCKLFGYLFWFECFPQPPPVVVVYPPVPPKEEPKYPSDPPAKYPADPAPAPYPSGYGRKQA